MGSSDGYGRQDRCQQHSHRGRGRTLIFVVGGTWGEPKSHEFQNGLKMVLSSMSLSLQRNEF